MRLVTAGLLLTLPACGAPADRAVPAVSPPASAAVSLAAVTPASLGQVAGRAREAGTVRFSGVVESSREGEPTAVDARLAGELDLVADAGDARLELVGLADLAALAAAESDGAAPALAALSDLRLEWTADEVTGVVDGQRETSPRADADSGVVARVPGEPGGLLDVVAAATGVTAAGQEQIDGVPTTRLRGAVDPRDAVDTGLGTSGQLAIADLPSLPVEVWLDAAGLPLRVRYTVTLPSLAGGTRTTVTTYDYRGWGEPVDLTG